MKKVLICGLPNSGKSQFRRYLVKLLREHGVVAEHWDADRFKKARCAADEDMKDPPVDESTVPEDVVWLIEDVRGTVPYKEVVASGEKEGAWKPLSYYDFIIHLRPDFETYALFWTSRALQWSRIGAGDWQREFGAALLDHYAAVLSKVAHFLFSYKKWVEEDVQILDDHVWRSRRLDDRRMMLVVKSRDPGNIQWPALSIEFMQLVGWKRRDKTEGENE